MLINVTIVLKYLKPRLLVWKTKYNVHQTLVKVLTNGCETWPLSQFEMTYLALLSPPALDQDITIT